MIQSDWLGCYNDNWKNEITPDAFAHPAKFSRGLIRRIYQHVLEEGWIAAGDQVLDPFGGVSLGGRDAVQAGLHWVGVELEPKFVELGNQNIALWQALADRAAAWGLNGWGTATLLQGDSQQWADLCISCGFELVHWHRAWLVEDRGSQHTLFGEVEHKQVARKSFFRRLYESKYPENSIDWEDVLCMRLPE
jgi:hypothetical protein